MLDSILEIIFNTITGSYICLELVIVMVRLFMCDAFSFAVFCAL